MVKWNSLYDKKPPKNTILWGFDVYHNNLDLVIWRGGKNDFGLPDIDINDERVNDDDNLFLFWQIAALPDPPSEFSVEAARNRLEDA